MGAVLRRKRDSTLVGGGRGMRASNDIAPTDKVQ
jgi:hypothetical protein